MMRRLAQIGVPATLMAVLAIAVWWLSDRQMAGVIWVLALVMLLVLVTAYLLWRHGRRFAMWLKRARPAPESPGTDSPAQATLGLRRGLDETLTALRKPTAGRARGQAVLHELPWYLVIGADGAGKTTLVRQSGLEFPLETRHAVGRGEEGCSWHLATEAVFIDANRRYVEGGAGQAEWLDLWRQLKRNRPREPLNGIVLTVSTAELLAGDDGGLRNYAMRLREYLNEIEAALGTSVPVYLCVTKLDLLGSLDDYFDEPATGVLGISLTPETLDGDEPAAMIARRFDALRCSLHDRRAARLGAQPDSAAQAALFGFSASFAELGAPLHSLAQALLQPNPFHIKPLLRGVYFLAAENVGRGRAAAAVARRLATEFDVDLQAGAVDRASPAKAAFLRDVFRAVVLPDRFLVSGRGRMERQRWRLAAVGGCLGVLSLGVGLMTWSFVGNQGLLHTLADADAAVANMPAETALAGRLAAMVKLQGQLEQLRQHREDGRPWRLGFGLYQGAGLEPRLRGHYFNEVRRVMLLPVAEQLESQLGRTDGAAAARSTRGRTPTAETAVVAEVPSGLPIIPINGVAALRSAPAVARPEADRARPQPVRGDSQAALVDGSYNALKTYLMLGNRARMEAAHLQDQLPRHWRDWLQQHRGDTPLPEIHAHAQRLVAFYVAESAAPDLPLIDNDAGRVAAARSLLQSAMQQLPRHERLYRELKAAADTRFEAVSVARILDGQHADLMSGGVIVAGMFTRKAYENLLRDAFENAGQAQLRTDDWVLEGSLLESDGPRDTVHDRQALEALYRADYVDAWTAFLQRVVMVEQTELPQVVDALGRLADTRSSPLLPVLDRAAHELGWLSGGVADRTGESQVGVLARARRLVQGETAGIMPDTRALTSGVLAGVAELGARRVEPSPQVVAYLGHLAKLRERLAGLQASGAQGDAALRILRATLDGDDPVFSVALAHIDGSMLDGMDAQSRALLRPLLVRPLLQAFTALTSVVGQDVNQVWLREVYPQWRRLAEKYPFSDTANEALFSDLADFVRSGGVLDRFVTQRLDGLVSRRGNQLVVRAWGGQGLALSPAFVSGVERLFELGGGFVRDGEPVRFELQPVPTPGLSEIAVEIDGQQLRYRNGPQSWLAFAWPGDERSQGASIRTVDFAGASAALASHPGRMGLLRLLANAQVSTADGAVTQLEWRPAGDSGAGSVKMNLRVVSGASPLQLLALRRLTLPERITR